MACSRSAVELRPDRGSSAPPRPSSPRSLLTFEVPSADNVSPRLPDVRKRRNPTWLPNAKYAGSLAKSLQPRPLTSSVRIKGSFVGLCTFCLAPLPKPLRSMISQSDGSRRETCGTSRSSDRAPRAITPPKPRRSTGATTCRIDIFDRLPVPYGLIRTGVAPDHQSIKAVSRRYEAVALSDNVRFVGNVTIGERRLDRRTAGALRRGRARHRRAARPPARPARRRPRQRVRQRRFRRLVQRPSAVRRRSTPTCRARPRWSSAWAMSRSTSRGSSPRPAPSSTAATSSPMRSTRWTPRKIERIVILGRRGPHQIMMTPKELGELGHLTARLPARRSGATCPSPARTRCSSRACASRSTTCAASPRSPRRPRRHRRSTWSSISSPRPRR